MRIPKLLFTLLFFTFSSFLSLAQTWNWAKLEKPGGADPSYWQAQDPIVAADDSGNIYITGDYFGNYSIAKYNSNGNNVWLSLPAFDSSHTYCHTVSQSGGNEYVAGVNFGKVVFGKDTLSAHLGGQTFVVKYNSGGKALWARQSKSIVNCNTGGQSVASDSVGDVYVSGFFVGTIIFGTDTLSSQTYGVFVVKYDINGNCLWARAGVNNNAAPYSGCTTIATDNKGDVFISGTYGNNDYLIFGKDTLPATTASSVFNAFAVKYDLNGNLKWAWSAKMPKGSGRSNAICISADNAGNAYIAGEFSNGTFTIGSITLGPVTKQAPFYAKINSNGTISWAKECFAWDNNQWQGDNIATDNLYNNYLLLNTTYFFARNFKISIGTDTFKLNTSSETADVLVKFDTAGNVKCGSIFTEGSENDGDGIGVSPSGKYIYVNGDIADTGIFGKDTLYGATDYLFLASWEPCDDNTATAIPLTGAQNGNVILYPNPNNGIFTIQANSQQLMANGQVEIYNILGEKVYSESNIQNPTFNIDLSSQPNGIYLYRVLNENGSLIGEGKVVIAK